jgi:HSP90 family molecular chaperone
MRTLEEKQNITLRLSKETIHKARILAAKRSTSISGLLTSQIEELAKSEDDYERAMDRAFARIKKGFHMGEIPKLDRQALHDRAALRRVEPL